MLSPFLLPSSLPYHSLCRPGPAPNSSLGSLPGLWPQPPCPSLPFLSFHISRSCISLYWNPVTSSNIYSLKKSILCVIHPAKENHIHRKESHFSCSLFAKTHRNLLNHTEGPHRELSTPPLPPAQLGGLPPPTPQFPHQTSVSRSPFPNVAN